MVDVQLGAGCRNHPVALHHCGVNMGMISRIYGNEYYAKAKRSRDWQAKRNAKKAARRLAKQKAKPKPITQKPRGKSGPVRIIRPGPAISFYDSPEWIKVRYQALRRTGAQCQCCGRTRKDGTIIHVDHIKPRSKYPHLELDPDNLQVLCRECNLGKSNTDEIDWQRRGLEPAPQHAKLR